MNTHYILIDFENVQPSQLPSAPDVPLKVMIFVGEQQHKVSLDLAAALQSLGPSVEYVRITGQGQNALDFHLAYWIGRLAERDPRASFHIVSRDKGFDPLVRHLRSQEILAQRITQAAEINIHDGRSQTSRADQVETVVESLKNRGNSRPRRRKTLRNSIASLFMNTLGDEEVDKIVDALLSRNLISIENEVVSYHLSEEEKPKKRTTRRRRR